jgi:hypothetical protein
MSMESKQTGSLVRFFSNPVVGMLGSLASIVGVLLAVYFYAASVRQRDISYVVHPAKVVVVKAGQISRLEVTLDGKKLKGDVTAAQVALWNDGNESVRREHVLKPFVIRTSKSAPIIDARIIKRSRAVTGLALDNRRAEVGELVVSWNILEQNDGGVIQLVFAGSPETPISAEATIEGQPKIKALGLQAGSIKKAAGLDLVLGVFLAALLAFRFRAHGRIARAMLIISIVTALLSIAVGIYGLTIMPSPEPPFGF